MQPINPFFNFKNNKIMKKKTYEKPTMQVVMLKQQPQLLAGSGLGNPADYPNGGNPFGSN